MKSYLFYDTETSGLNQAFDQILEFAAIRTDLSLNEIERCSIQVRLRPDVIISPRAMITHRISIQRAISAATCEYEAARQIHSLVNEPGTISIGYNSLGFDDDFLRFTFHRNLLPPYTHQYGNGCRRMDLFPMTICFHLYKSDHLAWPLKDGRTTLKLEQLNAANRLADGRAHDAMTDTEVALALARRLKSATAMWEYLGEAFSKDVDAKRMEQLPVCIPSAGGGHRLGLIIGGEYGPDQLYQAPALSIGRSVPYGNQTLWLRLDRPELSEVRMDTIAENTWVVRKRKGEPPIILPPHDRFWQLLDPARRALVDDNISFLKSRDELLRAIIAYHRDFEYPFIPDLDADAALFQMGFPDREEQERCRRFHLLPLSEKQAMIDRFATPEIRILAGRIIGRNYPRQSLPAGLEKEFQRHMRRVNPENGQNALVDFKGQRRTTPVSALMEIAGMLHDGGLDDEQRKLLEDLQTYIRQQFYPGFNGELPPDTAGKIETVPA
ncbi:MAG: exonuclease domain-containing protein [Thermodesulfobacteriota bacterium]